MKRRVYAVAVRELFEFAAKEGDLDLRFTPSPTAEECMLGHKAVASRRGAGRRAEVPVTGAFEALLVLGRIDGYSESRQLPEEVTTFKAAGPDTAARSPRDREPGFQVRPARRER